MYKCVKGKPIDKLKFNIVKATRGRNKGRWVCDDIMCFDTETTNAFFINGRAYPFDYDNPKNSRDALKHSIVYVWQFSINNNIYVGRMLEDFIELLNDLNAVCDYYKYVYVHNLAFDFVYLTNVLAFSDVFARTKRHPITARVEKYNIEFRCSYVLTNMSLDEWGKKLNLEVKKQTGLLDYTTIRTPYTKLTRDELLYCICDVLVMFYGLKEFRDKYGNIYNIPLTHTGEMRRECEIVMNNDALYCLNVTKCTPANLNNYLTLCDAFIGGTVLCNWLYKDRVIYDVDSWDIASSYPWVLLACKYPMTQFFRTDKYEKYMDNDKYLYIVKFTVKNVESKTNCHFLSRSKANSIKRGKYDNGRVIRAEEMTYTLTSVDFEIFKKCYDYAEIEINSFWWAKAGYLSDDLRRFILSLYVDKTTLKGVAGEEKNYLLKKQYINSTYGDFVTKIFSKEITFDDNEWNATELTEEAFNDKRKGLFKKRFKNYKTFSHGVFCTAHARARLWAGILSESGGEIMDEKMCYCDTDSLKTHDYNGDFFIKENERIKKEHERLAKDLNVDISLFSPVDIKGKVHPIGYFEFEETYKEFKSTGCKQYIVKTQNDELHLTCAGVSKKAVGCFKSVDDFEIDTTITENMLKECGCEKLLSSYNKEPYPVVMYPDGFISKYKWGVNLMPTTFNVSMTPEDILLLYTEVKEKMDGAYYNLSRRHDKR